MRETTVMIIIAEAIASIISLEVTVCMEKIKTLGKCKLSSENMITITSKIRSNGLIII